MDQLEKALINTQKTAEHFANHMNTFKHLQNKLNKDIEIIQKEITKFNNDKEDYEMQKEDI